MPGPVYAINGIPIHEGHSGWRVLRSGTNTQGGITKSLNKSQVPGRPGYRPGPNTFGEQILVFVVRTPRERLDELLALCDAATELTRVEDSTKVLPVELSSAIPSSNSQLDSTHDVTITLSAYEGVWRDASESIVGPTTIASPVQTFNILTGISAPISDMDVFISGVFGQFTLIDSGGSWLKTTRAWPGSSSNGILYVGATQQAFLAYESSPWVPVGDRSQYVDVSGNGGFKLTPQLVSGNPADRRVQLSLTTLTQTSATFLVRSKRAYRMN